MLTTIMEEQHRFDNLLQAGDNEVKGLQDKIQIMWKTIEDLKVKVLEEKELLRKEKSENERMMEEQIKLRKQLSVFHLPHCPAYNSPPCPVHSMRPQSRLGLDSDTQLDSYCGVKMDEFLGFPGGKPGQSFEELMRSLEAQPGASLEDLFEESKEPRPAATDTQDPASFTLLLSEQWQSRRAATNTRASHDNAQIDATLFTSNFEPREQFTNTSQIYSDF